MSLASVPTPIAPSIDEPVVHQPALLPDEPALAPAGSDLTVPVSGTALLLIDVVNDLATADAEPLIAPAEAMAPRLAALKRRAGTAGVPAIYVNDTFGGGRRPDFRMIVGHCTARTAPGHVVSSQLRPGWRDYFVPKPKHSGFYDTGLEAFLERLDVRRVIVAGIAGNICVLFTANDAYMRDLEVLVPSDCTVSTTAEDNDFALRQIATVLKGDTSASPHLRFVAGRGPVTHAHTPVRPTA